MVAFGQAAELPPPWDSFLLSCGLPAAHAGMQQGLGLALGKEGSRTLEGEEHPSCYGKVAAVCPSVSHEMYS